MSGVEKAVYHPTADPLFLNNGAISLKFKSSFLHTKYPSLETNLPRKSLSETAPRYVCSSSSFYSPSTLHISLLPASLADTFLDAFLFYVLCGVDTSGGALSTESFTAPVARFSSMTASLCAMFSTVSPFTATIWSPRFSRPSAAAAPDANTVFT